MCTKDSEVILSIDLESGDIEVKTSNPEILARLGFIDWDEVEE